MAAPHEQFEFRLFSLRLADCQWGRGLSPTGWQVAGGWPASLLACCFASDVFHGQAHAAYGEEERHDGELHEQHLVHHVRVLPPAKLPWNSQLVPRAAAPWALPSDAFSPVPRSVSLLCTTSRLNGNAAASREMGDGAPSRGPRW